LLFKSEAILQLSLSRPMAVMYTTFLFLLSTYLCVLSLDCTQHNLNVRIYFYVKHMTGKQSSSPLQLSPLSCHNTPAEACTPNCSTSISYKTLPIPLSSTCLVFSAQVAYPSFSKYNNPHYLHGCFDCPRWA
jgi:hypothetical protein